MSSDHALETGAFLPRDETTYGIRVTRVAWASAAAGGDLVGTRQEMEALAAARQDAWLQEHAADEIVIHEVVPYVGKNPAPRSVVAPVLRQETPKDKG